MSNNLFFKPQIEHDPYKTITDDQCNTVFVSSCLYERIAPYPSGYSRYPGSDFKRLFEELKSKVTSHGYKFGVLHNTKDIWCRDYMPVQMRYYNFWPYIYNPDYLRRNKKTWGDMMTDYRDVTFENNSPLEDLRRNPKYIADGGNIVKCGDYVILTEKIFDENPEMGHNVTNLFEDMGIPVVPIPADPDKEEFCGHADGIIRYVGDNVLLMRAAHSEQDADFLESVEEKIRARKPYVIINHLDFSGIGFDNQDKRNWCYINFLRLGNSIFLPMLSDLDKKVIVAEDSFALLQFAKIFPHCEIVPIYMGDIVKYGGALNCLTWSIKQ